MIRVLLTCTALVWAIVAEGNATTNFFGMGLVNSGGQSWQSNEIPLVQNLAGDHGKILLIFAGVQKGLKTPLTQWTTGLASALQAGLEPIVRLNPPWGQSNIRDSSDDALHLRYTQLASVYASIVQQLLQSVGSLHPQTPLRFQIGNEFNLCDSWTCEGGQNLTMDQTAKEVAHFTNDVFAAIKSIRSTRVIQVGVAPMAPGGTVLCNCCGSGGGCKWQGGATGLQFMSSMLKVIPTIYAQADFLASHSYPAQGIGWGFFCPFSQARPGLLYYQNEAATIARPNIPVFITETGWTTKSGCTPSLDEEATFMVSSYQLWSSENAAGRGNVQGVMPFQLMDSSWQDQGFYWVDAHSGSTTPQYNSVRTLRCQTIGGC